MANIKAPGSPNAYRRQKQIEDCLYESLLLRPYSSVSISDLCHQLDLSRKSFYNYYPDKDSCFRSLINRCLQNCMLYISRTVPQDGTHEDSVRAFLQFCKDQKPMLDIIARNHLQAVLMDQCTKYVVEEDRSLLELLNTEELETDVFVLTCFVSVNITLILHWYQEGFQTPLEEMVQKYLRLTRQPLLNKV